MKFVQFNQDDAGPTKSSEGHPKAFPFCGSYLVNWMNPVVLKAKVPQRWNVFVKWCGSEARAIEACTWGKGPLVQINSREVGHANGRYRGGDTVFIHGKVANKYEAGDGWIIWEATVFHEMIHWARHQDRLKDGNVEVGPEFEKEAYGEAIELTTKWRPGP
ncbi:MAG: hypothetical protein NVS9B9_29140 [Ktedonobacteraceae bacterium]